MVALWICGLSCLCMILSVLFFPKLRLGKLCLDTYWLVVLAGAVVMLATGQVTLAAVKDSFFSDSAINPLKILVLFLSMTMLSVFLDEVGFFRYLANAVLKKRSEDVKGRKGICNHTNLLTGKLFCAHCGAPYYRHDSVDRRGNKNST